MFNDSRCNAQCMQLCSYCVQRTAAAIRDTITFEDDLQTKAALEFPTDVCTDGALGVNIG